MCYACDRLSEDIVATLQIAKAEGWDTITTIDSLISKAGYRGCPTAALREALQVTRYQVRPYQP